MTLSTIHTLLGNAVAYYALIITVWTLFQVVRRQGMGGSFWGALIIGEALILLQIIVGVVMLLRGQMPARPIHFLYGGLVLLTWPAVFAFTRGETGRREMLFWLFSGAFLFGISLRASSTGGF